MITNSTKTIDQAPVVCGTNFSKASAEVSVIAAMIANALGVPLKLVFARNWLADGATPDAAAAMDVSYKIRLKEEVQKLEKMRVDIEPIICQGSPSDALIQVATDQKAQLVILGWHSANSRWHIGSVPERAVGYSPAPVLVIQNPEKFKTWLSKERPLKIFVGTDFSHSADTALNWVKSLSDIGPCDITATYIDKPSEEEKKLRFVKTLNISGDMQRVQKTLERDLHNRAFNIFGNDEVKTLVFRNWASKCSQLIMLAENDDADLIVIGTHQRLGINKLKKDSFSHDILRQSYTNVACVPSCTAKATVHPKIRECKRVLVTEDLKEPHRFTAAHAYSIAVLQKSHRPVLHVQPPATQHNP